MDLLFGSFRGSVFLWDSFASRTIDPQRVHHESGMGDTLRPSFPIFGGGAWSCSNLQFCGRARFDWGLRVRIQVFVELNVRGSGFIAFTGRPAASFLQDPALRGSSISECTCVGPSQFASFFVCRGSRLEASLRKAMFLSRRVSALSCFIHLAAVPFL